MKPVASAFLFLAGAILMPIASAATLTFSSAADYDNNFYETTVAGSTSWNGSTAPTNTVVKGTDGVNSATTMIYNTTATGGVSGSGGTGAATANNNTFTNVALQMDYSASSLLVGGNSLGFYTRVNAAGTTGYAAIFRITSSTTVDFRVWDYNANPTTGDLSGTQLTVTPMTITGTFSASTFYTFLLTVQNVGGNVQFTGSVYAAGGGAQIGSSVSVTDTSSPTTTAGQVGLRLGSNDTLANYYDNFSVTPIPEPSAAALAGTAALAGLLRRKRK